MNLSWSIKKRLTAALILIEIVFIFTGIISVYALINNKEDYYRIQRIYQSPSYLINSVYYKFQILFNEIGFQLKNKAFISRDNLQFKQLTEKLKSLSSQLNIYHRDQQSQQIIKIFEKKKNYLVDLISKINQRKKQENAKLIKLISPEAALGFSTQEIIVINNSLIKYYRLSHQSIEAANNVNLKYILIIGMIAFAGLILLLTFQLNLNATLLTPLQKCIHLINRIKDKNLEQVIPVELLDRKDEIGEFAKIIHDTRFEIIKTIQTTETDAKTKLEEVRKELSSAYKEISASYQELEKTKKQLNAAEYRLDEAYIETQQAVRLKAEFLSLITNELRTPLTGILGFSEFLLVDKKLDTQTKECVNYIHESGNRLYKLIDEIIMLAMIEAGSLVTEYTSVNICEMIKDLKILYQSEILKKKIEFNFSTDCGEIIYCDNIKLRQILFNLVGNAVKFTVDGIVSVHLTETDDHFYQITITDTGYGIDAGNFENIYNMFWQEETTNKRRQSGIGIGLAISKKLVEALKGEIHFESIKGKGSKFIVTLPVPDDAKNRQILVREKLQQRDGVEGLNILFAEDDMIHHEFLKNILNRFENVKFKGFYNGAEVIEELAGNPHYDIVILDIQMPVMDGISCVQKIRQMKLDIPVIALTAYYRAGEDDTFLEAGFNDFVIKPINIPEFEQKIKELVS